MPGKPFTLDNYRSLQVASVCDNNGLAELGITPTDMDAVVPAIPRPRLIGSMPRIWISIGSNIDAEANVRAAVDALRNIFGEIVCHPSTAPQPVGFDGPPFLNLVAGFDTRSPAGEVLRSLGRIEDSLGRVRGPERFDSRTIDLDLLTYGDAILSVDGHALPRDEILEYAFVLRPLADVAPAERHPVDGRTYAELWRDFAGDREGMEMVRMFRRDQAAADTEHSRKSVASDSPDASP